MPNRTSPNDSWSSLLSELGVEDPIQSKPVVAPVVETTSEQPVSAEPEITPEPQSPPPSSGKASKFGSGILPETPSLMGSPKQGSPKKSQKMSFFDRLASISLFGAGGSPEKINPAAIVADTAEPSSIAAEIEPQKLKKVEENPTERKKPEQTSAVGAVDPWSKIATQLGVRAEMAPTQRAPEKAPEKPRQPAPQDPPAELEELPDIESMTSFRDLPSKKKREPVVVQTKQSEVGPRPASASSVETSRPSRRDDAPRGRRDSRSDVRSEPKEERNAEPKTEKSDWHSPPNKRGRRYAEADREERRSDREELEMTPVYDEALELEDLDLVAPVQQEKVPSYSLDGIDDDDEMPVLPKKRARTKHPRSRRYLDVDQESESTDSADSADDFEVLSPPTERDYGPSRDVFADLFPEDEGQERKKTESYEAATSSRRPDREENRGDRGKLSRGSRSRGGSGEAAPPQSTSRAGIEPKPVDDDELFAHFSKKPTPTQGGRGQKTAPREKESYQDSRSRDSRSQDSRSERSRPTSQSSSRSTSGYEEDAGFEEERTYVKPAGRGSRRSGPAKTRSETPEPREERDEQEEQELIQLHRNIPGWDDAILPIVESNIARHANRPNHRKKR